MIFLKFRDRLVSRWTLQSSLDRDGFDFGFVRQHRHQNGEWESSHTRVYLISLDRYFSWGISHFYYDGPHCSLSIGPFRFMWGGNPKTGWCQKCMPGGRKS